jgi:hypothetical protein
MDHEFDSPHEPASGSPDSPLRADDDAALRMAVDSCRPGSDDRRLPEVAEILERHPAAAVDRLLRQSEKADGAIMAAMRQLPAPERLAERLLAALASQRAEVAHGAACCSSDDAAAASDGMKSDGAAAQVCTTSPPSCDSAQTDDRQRVAAARRTRPRPWALAGSPRGRRAWLGAVSLALIGVVAYLAWPSHRQLAQADVEQRAREFYLHDDHAAELSRAAAPLPGSVGLAAVNHGWRSVHDFLGRSGVNAFAHELVNRRGVRATLYVAPLDALGASGLDNSSGPVETAGSPSAGVPTAWAWTEAGRPYLFVLVVEGNRRDLESFLSSGGLA